MTGSFGVMGNLLKQAQQMQKALEEAREELNKMTFEGTGGGGVVSAVVNGAGGVESVRISEEAMRGADHEMLGDLVLAALRDGLAKADRAREQRMAKVTGGLPLPGFM